MASASDSSEARGLEHGHAPTVRHGSVDLSLALASLREKERRVLVSWAVVGPSISEIAVELDASEGTVRVWLSRACAAVAAELNLSPALQAKRGDDP